MGDNPDEGQNPEERVDRRQQRRGSHECAQVAHALEADLPSKYPGRPDVYEERLQVSLVPTGSLLNPVHEIAVCLLQRRRFEHFDLIVLAEHPDPEITILRNVEWVPPPESPQGAASKMVRCPAQWNRCVQGHETGKEEQEPHGV